MQITDANSVRVQIYNQAGQFVYETSTPTASSTCSSATPPNLIFCSGFEAQQGGGNPSSTRHIHLAGKQIARTSITSGNGNPAGTTTFVHTDLLGSVVAESTQAPPQITHRPLHEPYGAPSTGQYLQGPDYTGHVTDSTSGLSYMQARYYDPLAGRFLGVDPVGADLASGGNFNRYWYANNNPYKYTDPDGRNPLARNMPRTPQEAAPVAELAVDFTPIIGDIKAIAEAFADPTTVNIASAVIGLAGPLGDGIAKSMKTGSRIVENGARGRASETRVLADMGEVKNTDVVRGGEQPTIPDFQNSTQVGDIKDTARVTDSAQIRSQREFADATRRTHVVVTGTNTRVSEKVQTRSTVIRRDDLGPSGK